MLSIDTDINRNILLVHVHGQLTAVDVENILLPSILGVIKKHTNINLLIEFCQDFSGWEFPAIWDELKFNFNHRHQISKLAVVGTPQLADWILRIIFPIAPGGIERFTFGELEKAKAWLAF
jgi:hypothetical protein